MSYVIQRATRANADAAFIASGDIVNPDARVIGANVEGLSQFANIISASQSGPGRTVHVAAVTGGSGDRVEAGNILYFEVYSAAFWAGGTAEIWRITNGEIALLRTSQIVAATNTYVDLADDGGAQAQAGDMLILRQIITSPGDALADPRFYGGAVEWRMRFAPYSPAFEMWAGDDANDPTTWKQDGGEWYVEYDLSLAVASTRQIDLTRFHGVDGDFYFIPTAGVVYRVTVDMRADAARTAAITYSQASDGVRVVAIDGVATDTTFPVTIDATTSRQVFSVDFVFDVAPPGSFPRSLQLRWSQAGRYDLFAFAVHEAATPFRGLTPAQTARFDIGLDHIREMTIVKTRGAGKAFDLRRLIVDFLHASLTNTVSLGVPRFWIAPEFYLIGEADGLAEYLHGASGPWADLRASLGRAAPWTDDLDFLFEISNETWNSEGGFFSFPPMTDAATGTVYTFDRVYGVFVQKFIDAMKTAPAWDAAADAKFTFVIGGRFNTDYGDIAATHAPDATIVTRAPYVRGWEVGATGVTDSPQGFFETLFWPATITPQRLQNNDAWLAAARANGANPALVGGTYEDAISYSGLPGVDSGIPDEEVRFARTKTAGVCWFDKLAAQFSRYSLQSFFRIGEGSTWHSHHPATDEPYPTHLWNVVWNAHCAGALHDVNRFVRRRRTVSVSGDGATSGATYPLVDEIGCYLTSNGARRSVILVNRNLPYSQLDPADPLYDAADDGARTVLFVPNWRSAQTATRHTMNGAYDSQVWDASRPDYATFAVSAAPFATTSGVFSVTLPAASAEVFVFEDVA